MDLRDLTNLTNFSEETKSFQELRKEADLLLMKYRTMLGSNGSSSPCTDPEIPSDAMEVRGCEIAGQLPEPSGSRREGLDIELESPADRGAGASSSDMLPASLESLLITLRHPADGADTDATEEANGSAAVVLDEAVLKLEPADAISEDAVPNDLSSVTRGPAEDDTLVSPSASDDEPCSLDTDRAETSSEESTSIFETALNALRRSIREAGQLPERLANWKVSAGEMNEPESDGIPNSVSEELPKYAPPMDGRICTECGHETELSDERCEICAWVDQSLGVLAAVIAGDLNKVGQLLQAKPQIIGTRTSGHGWTLLHMAASGGNPKMAELLIANGVNMDVQTTDGKTPLHYAAGKGHLEVVRLLVSNDADLSTECNGKTALDLAEERGRDEVIDFLQGSGA